MSKRTLLLILALLVLTGVLLVVALSSNSPQTPPQVTPSPANRVGETGPTPVVQTELSISPNPATVTARTPSTLNVDIATGGNKVTAVQLEMTFDPTVLTKMAIAQGDFFVNPIVLLNKVDAKKGTITFALGIPPTGEAKSGTGVAATLSFVPVGTPGTQSPITILSKSLVTASGTSSSVLKSTTGTILVLR